MIIISEWKFFIFDLFSLLIFVIIIIKRNKPFNLLISESGYLN